MKLNLNTTGMVLGTVFGLWHLVWSVFVAGGFAQTLMDWVFVLHFLNNPFTVGSFNLMTAVTLIVFTSIIGYVVGWVFAYLWNWILKKK